MELWVLQLNDFVVGVYTSKEEAELQASKDRERRTADNTEFWTHRNTYYHTRKLVLNAPASW